MAVQKYLIRKMNKDIYMVSVYMRKVLGKIRFQAR